MALLSACARILLTGLVGPLLPERYRHLWPWPELLGTPGVQTGHAFLCAVAGVVLWMMGLVADQTEMAERVAALLADDKGTGWVGPVTHYGLVTYFAYVFTLRGFFLTLLLWDGIVRAVAAGASKSAPGTLFLAVPLGLARLAARGLRAADMRRRYGKASVPDVILQDEDGIRVRRTRPHPEWNAHLAYRYGGKFYRLHHFEEDAVAQGRPCFEYRFTPWPEGETLRRIVDVTPCAC